MVSKVQGNNKLIMNLYIDRLGDFARFTFTRVPDGWHFELAEKTIVSDHDGIEFFEYLRVRDQFSYSPSIGCYFEYLWDELGEGSVGSRHELQEKIDELSHWLSQCERTKPKW